MKGRRGFVRGVALALLAGLALPGLSGCGVSDPFPDYHFKTVVHAGGKTFSTVRAVKEELKRSIQSSTGTVIRTWTFGEAVIIELDGKTYYALIKGEQGVDPAFEAEFPYPEPIDGVSTSDQLAAISQARVQTRGPRELPRYLPGNDTEMWPMFVTFDNPQDPRTVRQVTPESIGVTKITLEITEEPVTTGIEGRLPYGKTMGISQEEYQRWNMSLPYNDPRDVSASDFSVRPSE